MSDDTDHDEFAAMSIRPGLSACKAVWLLVGERYLPESAPVLPLPECDRDGCSCEFNLHSDRREPGERRAPRDGEHGQPRSKGRRSTD